MAKKYEFKPDKTGTGFLNKLYLTQLQRQALLKKGQNKPLSSPSRLRVFHDLKILCLHPLRTVRMSRVEYRGIPH